MILHTENSKDTTRKLLELINEFGKVEGYKINTQKSVVFLYTAKKKIRKRNSRSNSIYHCIKKNDISGVNLPKETKDLYSKNDKMLVKDIKEDVIRWKDISCLWIGRINIVKMTVLPKAFYRFNTIPIKLPMVFSTELEEKISKFVQTQKTPNSQSNLGKEKWSWRNHVP